MQVDGPSWVEVEFTVDDSMLLGKGWKLFARSCHLTWGAVLGVRVRRRRDASVKIFRADKGREDCCVESDSSSHSSVYDDKDEDEDEENSIRVKVVRSPPS